MSIVLDKTSLELSGRERWPAIPEYVLYMSAEERSEDKMRRWNLGVVFLTCKTTPSRIGPVKQSNLRETWGGASELFQLQYQFQFQAWQDRSYEVLKHRARNRLGTAPRPCCLLTSLRQRNSRCRPIQTEEHSLFSCAIHIPTSVSFPSSRRPVQCLLIADRGEIAVRIISRAWNLP
jgi:hypothetical protein